MPRKAGSATPLHGFGGMIDWWVARCCCCSYCHVLPLQQQVACSLKPFSFWHFFPFSSSYLVVLLTAMGAAALQSQSVLLNFNIQHDMEVTELHIRWVLILEGHVLQYTRKCPFWGLFLNFETTIFFVLLKYYNFLPFFGSSLPSSFPFFAKHPWSAAHSTKQYIAVGTYSEIGT